MRYESTVTSVSWIPSEAMSGPLRVPVDLGIGHYDDPLPDHIENLEALRARTDSDSPTGLQPGSTSRTAGWSMPDTRAEDYRVDHGGLGPRKHHHSCRLIPRHSATTRM